MTIEVELMGDCILWIQLSRSWQLSVKYDDRFADQEIELGGAKLPTDSIRFIFGNLPHRSQSGELLEAVSAIFRTYWNPS